MSAGECKQGVTRLGTSNAANALAEPQVPWLIAGRVQSPALRILTEQESRIMAFQPEEWWTVDLTLTTPKGQPFKACILLLVCLAVLSHQCEL